MKCDSFQLVNRSNLSASGLGDRCRKEHTDRAVQSVDGAREFRAARADRAKLAL